MWRALILALITATSAGAAPQRVVSVNLCTDQLAMLMAAPGQLISVSNIARDPVSSAMHREAQEYPVNHGLAEEIFLLEPDLVLAGAYTSSATVEMLQRLGVKVVRFPIAEDFAAIRRNITHMGRLLGRDGTAIALIADFDEDLHQLKGADRQWRAVLQYSNSYTSGTGTLADEILRAAGFQNMASTLGYSGLTRLPLEALIMARPDIVISGQDYGQPSLAQEVLDHPALRGFVRTERKAVADNLWVCGTPLVIRAINDLVVARQRLESAQ